MKTITEYRPLIFGLMARRTREREINRRALCMDLLAAAAYGLLGFSLMLDLGSTPLEWQFWAVFGPIFGAGEFWLYQLLHP